MLQSILAICIGASAGAVLRWLLGEGLNALYPSMPPGTLLANLAGGYLAGLAVSIFAANPETAPHWRLFVFTGFLGAFTTFSAFSVEVMSLLGQKSFVQASLLVILHVGGSLLMTFMGIGTYTLVKRWLLFS